MDLSTLTTQNRPMGAGRASCIALVAVVCAFMVGQAAAEQAHQGKSAAEIAKELANPNNDLAKLTFKNQIRWYTGDLPDADDQANYTMLFQPIFPFSLGTKADGTKKTMFLRPAIPLLFDQPIPGVKDDQFDWDEKTAMGDWGFDWAYAETHKSGFLWAAGMVGTLPFATDGDVAGKQLRLGPEVLVAKVTKAGTFGIFPSHQWDVTGWDEGDSYDYSTTAIQPLIVLTPGGGWQVSSKPIIDYDWIDDQWTVPVTFGVAKTAILSGRPWQFEVEVSYYVEQADAFGPDWMLSLNVTPVVNNFIEAMFKGNK